MGLTIAALNTVTREFNAESIDTNRVSIDTRFFNGFYIIYLHVKKHHST